MHHGGKSGYVAEGPFLYEEDGKIVLLWSTFTQNGYAVVKGVSSNGVMGDYVFEKLLYDHDGGHSMSFWICKEDAFLHFINLIVRTPNACNIFY